jgi:hypothetical protein
MSTQTWHTCSIVRNTRYPQGHELRRRTHIHMQQSQATEKTKTKERLEEMKEVESEPGSGPLGAVAQAS